LQSIEQVEKVYPTGCSPLLVHCNNLEYYVCKYNTTRGAANLLFREYVSAFFLKLWELQVPDFAFVHLQQHHNPVSVLNIKNEIPCFGSLYNREYREIDAFIKEASDSQRQKFVNKKDLLKIALYDYWVANEDRNFNNYNIMLKLENEQYHFVPIDGNHIFHSGNQDKENYALSQDESLLFSPLMLSILKSKTFFNSELANEITENYYLHIKSCKSALHDIINQVPSQWQINKTVEYNNLVNFLFTEKWVDACLRTFLNHLQLSVNLRNK